MPTFLQSPMKSPVDRTRWQEMSSGQAILMTGAAVAALVVLAGRLPGHAEPGGNLWPANAQSDGVIDQHGKLCPCLPLRDPGALDQF